MNQCSMLLVIATTTVSLQTFKMPVPLKSIVDSLAGHRT